MSALRRIRNLAVAVIATALLAAPAAAAAAAATSDGGIAWTVQTVDNDLGTGRGNFTYSADPGTVITDAMRVVNTGTEPLPLAVYAADAFTTPSGQIDVLVNGTPSEDAGTWVSIEATSVELAPGQSADVAFTVSVPADAQPGDHAAGIVTSLQSTDTSQALTVDRRLGTRINVRVAGDLVPATDISALTATYTPSWNPFTRGTLTLSYAVANSGNTRLTGVESVSSHGPLGLFETLGQPSQLPEIIPGSTVEVEREVPVLSLGWIAGALTVVPEGVGLGAGSVDPVTVEYTAIAVPWSLYALLLLVASLVLVPVVVVVRRRARARGRA